MTKIRIALAQCNPKVGAIAPNAELIITQIHEAVTKQHADIIVFPELVLTGYPPDDLLFQNDLYQQITIALDRIVSQCPDHITVILGLPRCEKDRIFNSAAIIQQKKICGYYDKQALPNYGVFNEKRHFTPGQKSVTISHGSTNLSLMICEDLWTTKLTKAGTESNADIILCLNASPYHQGKQQERLALLQMRCDEANCPIAYVNMVGGQDELVFDGGSMIILPEKGLVSQAACFEQTILCFDINSSPASSLPIPPAETDLALTYQALCCGLRACGYI